MVKVIDLSKPVQFNRGDPFFMQVKVKHKPFWMAKVLVRILGLPFKLFPKDFVGWADDTITKLGVHATTHIDAPWHYGPVSGGAAASTSRRRLSRSRSDRAHHDCPRRSLSPPE